MHIGYVPRERPLFSDRSAEHIIFTNFKIFRSGASQFYSFCRSGDHNFRNFAAHARPTYSAELRELAPEPRTITPEPLELARERCIFTLPRRSGVSGRPECQPDASYSPFRPFRFTPELPELAPEPRIFTLELPELAPEPRIFTLELPELAPETSIFTLEPDPEPPIFHLAAAHTYQKLGWVPPPPGFQSSLEESKLIKSRVIPFYELFYECENQSVRLSKGTVVRRMIIS